MPNPNILHALAELYAVSYESLMERAGFVAPTRSRTNKVHGKRQRAAALDGLNLTAEEEKELVQYLGYLRSKRKPGP